MPQRALPKIQPLLAASVLHEVYALYAKGLGNGAFIPTCPCHTSQFVHLVTLQILRQRDVRLIGIGFGEFQPVHIQRGWNARRARQRGEDRVRPIAIQRDVAAVRDQMQRGE